MPNPYLPDELAETLEPEEREPDEVSWCRACERRHAGTCRTPKLGDELGHPIEPSQRWARLVGILKDPAAAKWAVVRVYRPGDRTGIPTGEYRRAWLLVPYEVSR
jgi:hypothetical protein